MNVLVACEYSGRVRDAFIRKGHNAISCDLLPSDTPGPHYQGDVRDLITDRESTVSVFNGKLQRWDISCNWDLMIAFPECTNLAVSGARWFAEKRADGRQRAAIEFFLTLANADIPKIAIENPIGIMSGSRKYLKKFYPDLYLMAEALPNPQIIHPWQFGHGETKSTCLWLKNLPKLVPTNIVEGREQKVHLMGPSPDRWKKRSLTYQGIADAMASQWG